MKRIEFTKRNGETDLARLCGQLKMATQLLPNGVWELTITKHTEHRSTNQNRLLMLWCNAIAKAMNENGTCGVTGGDVKETLKAQFLAIDSPIGKVARHTSKLTTEEMSDFLNHIEALAASELGITLPRPSDLLWAEFERQFSNN